MGIPRLFRLLVERYPLILQNASDLPFPSFDNFYLDFNGEVQLKIMEKKSCYESED
jgi:5'-3' exonuclease